MNPFSDLPFEPEISIELDPLEVSLGLATEELEALRREYDHKHELKQSIDELEKRRRQLETLVKRNDDPSFTFSVSVGVREARTIPYTDLVQIALKRLIDSMDKFKKQNPMEFRSVDNYFPYDIGSIDFGKLEQIVPDPAPPKLGYFISKEFKIKPPRGIIKGDT